MVARADAGLRQPERQRIRALLNLRESQRKAGLAIDDAGLARRHGDMAVEDVEQDVAIGDKFFKGLLWRQHRFRPVIYSSRALPSPWGRRCLRSRRMRG